MLKKIVIFQILSLLVLMQGFINAVDENNEPNWSLVEERGLFQSEESFHSGWLISFK